MATSKKSKYGNTLVFNEKLRNRLYLEVRSDQDWIDYPNRNVEPIMNQQFNVLEDALRLKNIVVPSSQDYILRCSYSWSTNTPSRKIWTELVLRNLTDNTEAIMAKSTRESKDSSGGGLIADIVNGGIIVGQQNTSTDEIVHTNFLETLFLDENKVYEVVLRFTSSQANIRSTIIDSLITLEEKIKDN